MKKIIILITMLCWALPFHAAAQSERVSLSTAEDVAIAFYRTGNVTPNFRAWIYDRPPYKFTPLARRPRVFEAQMQRLQSKYQGFNKRRDVLTVKIPVDINPTIKDGQYRMGLTIKGLNQAYYVTYEFLGENIALFPRGWDGVMNSVIDAAFYNQLASVEGVTDDAFIVMVLSAMEAKIDRPHDIDDLQQWVFETKIQNMTLYGGDNTALWNYTAPVDLSPITPLRP